MNFKKAIIFALGIAITASLGAHNIGLADCGGLFLLHQKNNQLSAKSCSINDSLEISHYKVYGSFEHFKIQGRYTDKWHIKSVNEQSVFGAGFESEFKYITLGVKVSSLPLILSELSIHSQDSLFKISTELARGKFNFGTISWIPEKESDLIGTIPVQWESHFIYKNISAESKIRNHKISLSGTHISSEPHNPDKDYYIRDSISAAILSAQYGFDFKNSSIDAGYIFADSDIELFGIFHNENSRKRFMYLPLDFQLHLGYAKWQFENLQTRFGTAHFSGKLNSNPNRFFETLAPNRALSASAIKGLSFSFLQKTFRVNADINASGILGGATYNWNLGNSNLFIPSVGLDIFAATGEIEIQKETETAVLLTRRTSTKCTYKKLNSIGSVISIDGKFQKNSGLKLALNYGISQIIPFYFEYKNEKVADKPNSDKSDNAENTKEPNASKDKSGSLEKIASALFRNGFSTHLGISISF